MGLLLLFVLLNWSNSQVLLVASCHGITSHVSLKGDPRVSNLGHLW
jgi:hypothetical protein